MVKSAFSSAKSVIDDDPKLIKEENALLKNELEKAQNECIVLVHECLSPFVEGRHIIKNAEKAREIIKYSQKVKTVISGHYHKGGDHTVDGIRYLTILAMCEGEENYYKIFEIQIKEKPWNT
jgi:predicted phosphodiesterase